MDAKSYQGLTTILMRLMFACFIWVGNLYNLHAEVVITGVDRQTRNNILAYMRLDEETCAATEVQIRRLFNRSETEIKEALEVVGYYNALIQKKLETNPECWQATFNIDLNQPVVLRNVSVKIDNDSSDGNTNQQPNSQLIKTTRDCNLIPGDVLKHANYEACIRRITRTAKHNGYFSAEFSKRRIDVYPAELAADINILLVPGPRYVFGKTTFDQTVLDSDLIRRFASVAPGEPYDALLVRRLQRDLVSSTYFDQVIFRPVPRDEPHFDVPIDVSLTPGKKFQYSAGIGFATDVGPKLRFGVLNRRVNSRGHQIEFDINVSRVISETGITYRIPLDKPRDWFTIDTGYTIEDNDSFRSELFTAGVQRVQQRNNDWIRTLFLNFRFEDYEAGRVDDGISRLLTPGISYSFVEEDYPPRPLEGHRSRAQLLTAVEGLVSDTSFAQVYGNSKWVFKLWDDARLLPRAEAGFTLIDELSTLPASVRFFAGGDTSVRGYGYNSLGPTDPFGDVVGGENLLVGSIELDQKIATDWSLAVFIDSGNAYNALKEFDPATGIGGGIRWFSPLGPIRVDVAVPLEKDAEDDYRIHITLGPDL